MNQFTYEKREELFESATDIKKSLYESHTTGLALGKISTEHSLRAKHIDFAIAVGDVILGLVPQEKLPELLTERLSIDQAKALQITADVLDFLAPLEQSTDVSETTIPINTEFPKGDTLANEIAEAEATMQKMQPIRTMSRDIEVMRAATEEPTHTSASQADLLKREAPANTDASAESTDTAQK